MPPAAAARPSRHVRGDLHPVVVGTAALASLVLAGVVMGPPAVAGQPAPALGLQPLGTFSSGEFDASAAEIPVFDRDTDRVFVTNATGTVDVLDVSDPEEPVRVAALDTPGANGIAVADGLLAVAEQADDAQQPGTVSFFDSASLERLGQVEVGALPDAITFTPNGRALLVANEGEPAGYLPGQVDPEGSVSVIDVSGGVPSQADVRTADFNAFDDRLEELRTEGVRIFGPGASVSEDLEPEYIAVDVRSRTAWVSLQEANALGVIDLRTAEVVDILPLGLKDHSLPGNGLDASDRDGGINISQWPVLGMYMPDAIDTYTARGRTFVVMANEGDAREYDGYAEEERVKDLELSPDAFGGEEAVAALQADAALGRLTATTTAPTDDEGRFTEIHAFGARSFSILDADGTMVFDSGDDFERITAERFPDDFNANNSENDSFDNRSDNKGPEPEGIEVGRVDGRTYAFIGLERIGGVMIYDITVPTRVTFVDYVNLRDFSGDLEENGSDSGIEGLVFVPASDSPTGVPLLVVGNEVSGTTTLFEVTRR
ncbi:choice-of-anchor I family protein [Aquipuribacter sp. MA13-6]|uniref:choice-of-anchor I family protein n=1 Tax=unclassified Aquipuribacter TaxID=2635084 RepID=UPI003EE95363